MRVQSISRVTFQHHSRLMDDFRNGKIKLKKDPYGYPLDKYNASHDHVIPKSKGGANNISNYLLANCKINNKRGSEPFGKYIKLLPLLEYLSVMLDVKTENIDGVEYVRSIIKTMIKALKEGK